MAGKADIPTKFSTALRALKKFVFSISILNNEDQAKNRDSNGQRKDFGKDFKPHNPFSFVLNGLKVLTC